jgi:hypothetical protein
VGSKEYSGLELDERTGGCAAIGSHWVAGETEGNLKFGIAAGILARRICHSRANNACAGEAAQAVARCAVIGTQGFRPGLGVCRAYGAGVLRGAGA